MGVIAIEGLQFYSHHGYHKEEQVLGGKYSVDIYLKLNFDEAAETDNLAKTINYEDVYQITKTEMEVHARLIEHVCLRILNKMRNRYKNITYIRVRVNKHNPPLKGQVDKVYVELEHKV